MIFTVFTAFPAHSTSSTIPLQSVDYFSSGRNACDNALFTNGTRTCLLSLQAVVTGGAAPFHVKWILSNGTRVSGQRISLAINYGEIIYGVCLRAVDSNGEAVFGGHWEFGLNYWSIQYHSHKYAPVNVWHASVTPPCATVGGPISFRGNVFCSSGCAPQPIVSTWSFGDGTMAKSDSVDHNYGRPGVYSAQLSATDSLGITSSANYPVIVVQIANNAEL